MNRTRRVAVSTAVAGAVVVGAGAAVGAALDVRPGRPRRTPRHDWTSKRRDESFHSRRGSVRDQGARRRQVAVVQSDVILELLQAFAVFIAPLTPTRREAGP